MALGISNIDLNVVLEMGEGQFIEFKQSIDKKFVKEFVAFYQCLGWSCISWNIR